MRICLLTHTMPRYKGDPSAPFIEVLINSLVDLGNSVTVVAPFDPKIDFGYKRKYKLFTYKYIFPERFHILGYSKTLSRDMAIKLQSYLLSPFLYFFGLIKLFKIVSKERFDIISAHWLIPNGFIASIVSSFFKIPFSVTIPGSDVFLAGQNPFFKWMAKFAASKASVVISDSHFYLKELNALDIYPKKTEIIRYGVDPKKYNLKAKDKLLARYLGLKEGKKVILAVGRLVPKKGFIYLIKALPKILEKYPDTKLVIVGDGDERKKLEETAKLEGVSKNVVFAGTVSYDDLPKYYALGSVFVMPSIRDDKGNIDASPVSMMEAMMCGLPVVTTSLGGDSQLINDQHSGRLVQEKSSLEIAEAILDLFSVYKNYQSKLKIRHLALKNFSSVVIAKKYAKIFQKSIL